MFQRMKICLETIWRSGNRINSCGLSVPARAYRERGSCDLKFAIYVEYVLEREGDLAAVISEPVQSTMISADAECFLVAT